MGITHIWHKFRLSGHKIALAALFVLAAKAGMAQGFVDMNNPGYDDRKFSYGFLIGIHKTAFSLRYSDEFASNNLDTLHSIQPTWSPGFSLGFLVNMKVHDYFDLRITPKVAFYEYHLEYNYTDQTVVEHLKESTIVEFPIVLKYKSQRRGNSRMYLFGGFKPGFEASGKNDLDSGIETLHINRYNLNMDFGVGLDLYFPLFKFSPELRFSKGLVNMLNDKPSKYSAGIGRLATNTIHLYFLFQ